MRFGLSDDQWNILQKLVIEPLRSVDAEIYIFGSRALGTHHPHSDVDLLFKTKSALPAGLISNILESIEESRFPFKLDLVNENELAASYRASVLASRIALV